MSKLKISTNKMIYIIIGIVFLSIIAIVLGTLIIRGINNKKYLTCVVYKDSFLVQKGSEQTTTIIDHMEENEYYRIHFDSKTTFTLQYKLKDGGDVFEVEGTYVMTDDTLTLTFKNYPEESFGDCIFKKDDTGKKWVREQFLYNEETRFTRIQEFKIGKK